MEKKTQTNRNYALDFVKGIACICVVFMHCEFPGRLGIVVQAVSRFCVPFFFMVSGYYCFENGPEKIKKKLLHIFKIILGASAFYLVFALIRYACGMKEVFDFSLQDVGLFLVLNQPVVIAGQLWFLFALLYDYLLFYFVVRTGTVKWAHRVIPLLIAVYIFFAQGAVLVGIHIPKLLYRNFLVEGFLFFMLGHWLHANAQRAAKAKDPALAAVILGSTLLCVAERALLGRDFGVNICTFPQVICIFILAMNHPASFENRLLRKLGTRCSMFVYILHPFVWHSLEFVYQRIGVGENTAALYALPLLVLGLSILLSLLVTIRRKKEA